MDDSPLPLILVGASVRAAARSARRAGFAPWAIDLFGDVDLRDETRTVLVCRNLADDLVRLWPRTPRAPWLYTGGLENDPDLLDQLADSRRLLGNDGDVVRAVRDPRQLQTALAAAGFAALDVRIGDDPPAAGRWLRKPLRSAGGLRMVSYDAELQPAERRDDCYFQEHLPDSAATFGATFVMNAREARLLGVCRHLPIVALVPTAPTVASAISPYQYGGASAWQPPDDARQELERLGHFLAARFKLRGVVGVDVGYVAREQVESRQAAKWFVLEVNPRFPASAQLLDDVAPTSVVGLHIQAARDGRLPAPVHIRPATPAAAQVAYAPSNFTWSSTLARRWLEMRPISTDLVANLADVPAPQTPIQLGQPLCTFVLRGSDSRLVEQQLAIWMLNCLESLRAFESPG